MLFFYRIMIALGLVGTGWFAYIGYMYTPTWSWMFSVGAFIAIEFGAFAYRDLVHEQGEK